MSSVETFAAREQSPIEARFLLALSKVLPGRLRGHGLTFDNAGPLLVPPLDGLQIFPQFFVLDDWRCDFLLILPYGSDKDAAWSDWLSLVVELDGHEFHERTAEQAERDRSRDRQVQSKDIPIFRFTGREINRSPSACANEVWSHFADRAFGRAKQATGGFPLVLGPSGALGWRFPSKWVAELETGLANAALAEPSHAP